MNQLQTTAPEIHTDILRTEFPSIPIVAELCDAIDTLRRHFAAQQEYIVKLNRRLAERTS